jgi:hypothetical protein
MKKALYFSALIAAVMIFAGGAHAQVGYMGSINNASTIGSGSGINGATSISDEGGISGSGSINPPHPGFGSSSSPVGPASYINVDTKNPGDYVPSTFTNFKDAVTSAKENAHKVPLTLAELARQTQMQKQTAGPKNTIVLDADGDGKLVMTKTKQQ